MQLSKFELTVRITPLYNAVILCMQEYLAKSGLPYALLLTSAFYDNVTGFMMFQKQSDGSCVYSDNLGEAPHSWHSVGTIGLTAAGRMF